ncbi:uncharacterized protein LOC132044231 [Lycium ferocissimum]|uniref:uncharacterized protein LOC132044231 n=1 Tax=Lycium ferocissimum TaxID=112874 RepID=UPI0028157CDB|nr:uncharacterized protein LOC132044231 [Lycium ferocissimum]
MEPFQQLDKIEEYKRRLGMHTAVVNSSGKIWIFVEDFFEVEILADHEQQITVKLNSNGLHEEIMDSLEDLATNINRPWMIAGDFNVIMSEKEKYGGLAVGANEIQDFKVCMKNCIEVNHLIRNGSDHAPLLISYSGSTIPIKKPFKFLNFWVKNETFLDLVRTHYTTNFLANPFTPFHFKLKKVKDALVQWSKDTFGNIFQDIETLEEVIKVHEIQFELQLTPNKREKLYRVQADMNRYLHLEEEFLKQKDGMQWFQDGDRNTKFFHAYVQGRRKRFQ